MNIYKYLIINSKGSVTIKEREPKLAPNEISLYLELAIPNSLFSKPQLQAKMVVPDEAVPKSKINTTITDNLEKIIHQATGLSMAINVVDYKEEQEKPAPSIKIRRKIDAPVEESGDFTNFQTFKKGDKIEFYNVAKEDPFSGIHTVLAVQEVKVGSVVKTDKSGDSWIHVHWFKPVKK